VAFIVSHPRRFFRSPGLDQAWQGCLHLAALVASIERLHFHTVRVRRRGARPRNIPSRLAFKKHTAWGERENIMRKSLCGAAVVAALLGSITVASAELNLTAQQKQMIMQSVQSEKGQPAPAGFQPRVGASVPQSMPMHQLPSNVTAEVPAAKGFKFAKLANNEVLLIDPQDMRVADIIMPSGTTGAAPRTSPIPGAPR
jgi:hypothetical protein